MYVAFPAAQWGSHIKQQPKKKCYHGNFSQNHRRRRRKRKREEAQKQTDRIKGSLWPFCLPALKWGARGEVEYWKAWDQSRKKKRRVWSQNEQEKRESRGLGMSQMWRFDFSIWLAFKGLFWLEKKRDIRGMKECHSWSSRPEKERRSARKLEKVKVIVCLQDLCLGSNVYILAIYEWQVIKKIVKNK